MNKKALTPVALTSLLILFAILLGLVIMNINTTTSQALDKCTVDVNLQFSTISDAEQLCFDTATQQIKFTIENGATTTIEGLIFQIDTEIIELDAKIGKAATYVGSVPATLPEEFSITPKIINNDLLKTCSNEILSRKNLPVC
jgi:hypothetical protein